jgi:periplasmic protein CpxP/Spy
MKKIFIFTIAFILPLTAFAFGAGYDGPPEHKIEHLTKELSLTPDQQTKMETIFKEQHEKFRAIHEESHNRIKEILNAEQMTKWEAMKKMHQDKHHKKMLEFQKQNP